MRRGRVPEDPASFLRQGTSPAAGHRGRALDRPFELLDHVLGLVGEHEGVLQTTDGGLAIGGYVNASGQAVALLTRYLEGPGNARAELVGGRTGKAVEARPGGA